jgi:sulfite oxidase
VSAEGYTVIVDGLVSRRLDLSIAALTEEFPRHSVTCVLQCAGNRRHSMRTRLKEVQGIDWLDGAIMNCRWDGPRLRDILLRAGVRYDNGEDRSPRKEYHVQFASHSQKTPEEDWYGGSIPLDRALAADKDVILAVKVSPAYSSSIPGSGLR